MFTVYLCMFFNLRYFESGCQLDTESYQKRIFYTFWKKYRTCGESQENDMSNILNYESKVY